MAVELSEEALLERLGAYVEEMAPFVLWPQDAEKVRSLLSAEDRAAAVDYYFARVGERWDQEYLHRATTWAALPSSNAHSNASGAANVQLLPMNREGE